MIKSIKNSYRNPTTATKKIQSEVKPNVYFDISINNSLSRRIQFKVKIKKYLPERINICYVFHSYSMILYQ